MRLKEFVGTFRAHPVFATIIVLVGPTLSLYEKIGTKLVNGVLRGFGARPLSDDGASLWGLVLGLLFGAAVLLCWPRVRRVRSGPSAPVGSGTSVPDARHGGRVRRVPAGDRDEGKPKVRRLTE